MPAPAGPLFAQLRDDAKAAAVQRVEQARRDAQSLRAGAERTAAHRRSAATAEHECANSRTLENVRADVSQRVRHETLAARAAALDRVFGAAVRSMEALAEHPRLAGEITRTVAEALAYLPEGVVTVRCASAVAELARGALASLGRTTDVVRVEEGLPLGVIVESADGAIAVDETFASRLASARPRLAIALVRQIEGRAE